MSEFFEFMKVLIGCGTVVFLTMMVLLALPQSKLRLVGLELTKWVMAMGLLVMIPGPLDVLPDVAPPFTYIDDIGYLVAAIAAIKSARADGRKRKLMEEIELAEMQARRDAATADESDTAGSVPSKETEAADVA